jgi:hypothetical protein
MTETFSLALKMVGTMGVRALLSLSKSPTESSDEATPEAAGYESADSNDDIKNDDPVPKIKEEGDMGTFNLSKYEELKVVELLNLLRKRKCKTVGRKHILIQRLASVYKVELETLTVRQLGPILKSKGFKQSGLKSEIIQRLVEAGM